jgi:predicted RNA-binding Zn ribbon-like protein
MMATQVDPPVFSLCGGHPVLDLVNTLDNRFAPTGPIELLPTYGALLMFLQQCRLLEGSTCRVLERQAPAEGARARAAAIELRESAAAVLYSIVEGSHPPPREIHTIERHCAMAQQHQQLRWNAVEAGDPASQHDADRSGFVWDWQLSPLQSELPVWILALQTSALLTSTELSRLRSCQCDTCRWLFLDTSKNHSRRWCDMQVCGNRMKARRFQARGR